MTSLVNELRTQTESGTADYTLGTVTYWTDDQLQQILDRYRTDRYDVPLTAQARNISGTAVYHEYAIPFVGYIEGTASGSAAWDLRDENHDTISSGYTPDLNTGMIRFDNDQGGSARYLSYRTFDFNRAARDVWIARAGHLSGRYDVQTDNHLLKRSQYHKHCVTMAAYYEQRAVAEQRGVLVYRADDICH